MVRLRRTRPKLGQLLLLQRRRAGKSGHAQRISCSSLGGVEEGREVKRKWRVEGGGGLSVRPLCSCSCAGRFHCSSSTPSRLRSSRNDVEGLSTVFNAGADFFFAFFSFLFPLGSHAVSFEICTVGPHFPYLCFCSAKRILDKVRDDMKC